MNIIARLTIVGLCLFSGLCLHVFEMGAIDMESEIKNNNSPDSVPAFKIVETDWKPGNYLNNISVDSTSLYRIEYKDLLSKKYLGNWWKGQVFSRDKKPSEWNRNNGYIIGFQTDINYSRKIEWQGIATKMAYSYAYKLNIQSFVKNYREMLLHGFSMFTNNLMEESLSENDEMNSTFFGHFYHSVTDFVNFDSDFGKLWVDPSLGFGATGIKLSYKFIFGTISSSWNIDQNKVSLRIRIPLNAPAGIYSPTATTFYRPSVK